MCCNPEYYVVANLAAKAINRPGVGTANINDVGVYGSNPNLGVVSKINVESK